MSKKIKKYKPCLGKALKSLGLFFAGVIMLAGCSSGTVTTTPSPQPTPEPIVPEPPVVIEQTYTVPTIDQAEERLLEIYEKPQNMYLIRNSIYRHTYAEDGAISVNICFEPSFVQKFLLGEAVEEFNSVFEIINSKYKFALNYNPSQDEIDDLNNINVFLSELNPAVGGSTKMYFKEMNEQIEGKETVACDIRLNTAFANDGRSFSNIFRHEFMHTLGCGDAYLLKDPPTATIMKEVSYDMFGLYELDVAFLDALYRDPENEKSDEDIRQYIEKYDDYEKYSNERSLLRLYKLQILENEIPLLKENIENSSYSMADIETVKATLGEDLTLQPLTQVKAFANLKSDKDTTTYDYYETPYDNENPQFYKLFKNKPLQYMYGKMLSEYNDDELLYLTGSREQLALVKVSDYVFAFKMSYKLSDITEDITSSFKGIYVPTNASLKEFQQEVLEWEANE